MKHIPLGDIATVERNSVGPESIVDGTLYVGLEHITGEGTFENVAPVSNGDLSSGKFQFDESHVLYGKLRPYLKKTALPTFSGICSTDILPIKPGPALDRRYLFYYLRQQSVVDFATSQCTGINLPRLSPQRLNEFEIPLPPLAEQKRIAAILDQADALRAKRRAALARLDALVQSVFLEMFGDPVTNPMGWEVVKLAQTFSTKPQIGTAVPAHEGGEQIIIRVGELGDDYVALENCKFVTLASKELKKFSVKAGDFLLARAIGSEDHLGKASLMQDTMMPVVYDSHVMRLRFDNKILLPQFFLIWMRTQGGRRRFMQRAGRTAVQFNINTKQISDIDLPLPPVSKQSQFVKFYDCIQIQQGRYTKALQIADKLFHSLQQRAFRGEL